MREDFDVIIVGAGPAGAAAAIGFADAGFAAALVDRADPAAARDDLRSTAILGPGVAFLDRIGVWSEVEGASTPLATLRIVDLGAEDARMARDFEAEAIGAPEFGRNVANAALKDALAARAAAARGVAVLQPAEVLAATRRSDAALVALETPSGARLLSAPLLIAADGRRSRLRDEAGIAARRDDHGRRATVAVFRHPEPHRNVSVEIYSEGGPFTLVPFLDDEDLSPRSSLVWMRRNREAAALEAMSDPEFAAAATAQSGHVFGPLTLASARMSWPVATVLAERFTARRLALMGEAAHATPPIGAQGLNMSLTDAEILLEEAIEARSAGRDIGGEATLAAYERARRSDVRLRVGAVAALDVAADGAIAPLRAARRFGLAAAHGLRPVRRALMRRGLGASA